MSAQSKPHEFESPFSLRQSAVSRTGLRDLPPDNLDHHSIAAKRGFRERARRSVCCWGDDAHHFCCSTGQQNWRGCRPRDRLDDRHAYVSRRARWVVPFNTAPPHSTRFNKPQHEHGKSRTWVGVTRRDGHANRCHNLVDHWRGGDGSQAYSSRVTVLEFNIVVGIIGVVLAGWPCRFPSYVSRLTICVEGLLNLRQAKCPSLAFAAPGRRRWATGQVPLNKSWSHEWITQSWRCQS